MPIDPYIFSNIQSQGTQNQLAQLQLRQQQREMQAQNTLRQLLQQPGMTDPATGLPTTNALGAITRVDPTTGLKLIGDISLMEERKVQTQKAQSELYMERQKADAEELAQNVAAYDADVSSGTVDPTIAETRLRDRMKDYIFNQPVSDDEKQKAWAKVGGLSLPELRALSITAEQRAKLADKEPYRDESGNTVFLDKQGNVYDANGKRIPAPMGLEKLPTPFNMERLAAEKTPYQGPKGEIYFVGKDGSTTDAQGNPAILPKGSSRLSGTSIRSGFGMAMQKYMQENPEASAEDVARFAGEYTGRIREEGAIGTRAGNIALAVTEFPKAAENSKMAFSKLGRTNFVPYNKLLGWTQQQLNSNPDQAAALVADNTLLNIYDRGVSGTIPRIADKFIGKEMLYNAQSPEAHTAAIDQMAKEMQIAKDAPRQAREDVRSEPVDTGRSSPAESPTGKWSSAQDVVAAYHAGKLKRDEAARILRDRGWAR